MATLCTLLSRSNLSSSMVRCTFLQKMTTWFYCSTSRRSYSLRLLSFSLSCTYYCCRPCSVSLDSSSMKNSILCFMKRLHTSRMSLDMVALNIITCLS